VASGDKPTIEDIVPRVKLRATLLVNLGQLIEGFAVSFFRSGLE
jgi:hypothetical protein